MAPCAYADGRTQRLELGSGTISTTVKNHDGKPLAKWDLNLFDKDDRLVASAKTDAKGTCKLDGVKPGAYRLVVAKRAAVPFSVSDKAETEELMIVLPAPRKYAAGEAKEAVKLPVLLTFIIGGIAVAGLGYAVFHDGSDTHGKKHP
jgi:hypothetical protein